MNPKLLLPKNPNFDNHILRGKYEKVKAYVKTILCQINKIYSKIHNRQFLTKILILIFLVTKTNCHNLQIIIIFQIYSIIIRINYKIIIIKQINFNKIFSNQ